MKRFFNAFKHLINWPSFWYFYYKLRKTERCHFFKAFLKNGLKLEIPPALVSAFDEIFLREVYNIGFDGIKKNPLIVDIGANAGFFCLFILSKFPLAKIVAFEPVPSNFRLLTRHKEINKLTNLSLDKRAVLGIGENVTIGYNKKLDFCVGASFLKRKQSDTFIDVPAMSIPGIFKEYKIDSLDLLKIDCEGAEYNILFNCPPDYFLRIKNIAIEVHQWVPKSEGTIPGLVSFLEKQGYSIVNKKNEILWCKRNDLATPDIKSA